MFSFLKGTSKPKTGIPIDWLLVIFLVPLFAAGLITMTSFAPTEAASASLFWRQLIFVLFSFGCFFAISFLNFNFLKRTDILVIFFLVSMGVLGTLFVLGNTAKGATSWFSFGGFSFQPADFTKLVLILILSKYFSRRHVEIAHFKHILVSGLYAFVPFILVFLQPDFGSAIILFLIWFGMILVSGISKRHLLIVFTIGALVFGGLWAFVFEPYQKARIMNFVNPLADVRGTGYNAYQSAIAVGSGQVLGKGVGFGTQSRLKFLPEYETDFIFAAFSEEWGFVGSIIVLILFGLVVWRVLDTALRGSGNFEMLFGMGVAIFFLSHIIINIGMNIGLMPVTGIALPFMSYGGSHILTEMVALGILMGMRRYGRPAHRDDIKHEFMGVA